jgi:branched-chain amino acid transport system ATP-binding protein
LRFAGQDIQRLPTYRIARLGLGYVPEDRRIFTDLTVYENLEVGAKAAMGDGREPWTPERLFSIFPNLAEMRGRRASQMSGGEQQMLTIARTLMGNPQAVLLDEPSEGLAPVIVELMAVAVRRMKAEGIAVLLSEQNLYFASGVADRTYIIEKGAIRHEGCMADIVSDAALREAYLTV